MHVWFLFIPFNPAYEEKNVQLLFIFIFKTVPIKYLISKFSWNISFNQISDMPSKNWFNQRYGGS